MSLDSAVGSRAVWGRGIEKVNLGLPTGDFEFINFESADLSRNSKENPSNAITGKGGRDRGTPGEITAEKKAKYAATASRLLYDFVIEFGKPTLVRDLGSGVASTTITAPGSLYTAATVAFTAAPAGGTTATGTVTVGGGAVTGIVITNPGRGYAAGSPPTPTISGDGSGATATSTLSAAGPWLVKIRPTVNEIRSGNFYIHEGGSYTPSMQIGRRASEVSIGENANKPSEVDVTYTEPTGDTITGLPIAKSTNSGSLGAGGLKLMMTRGRRPNDANFLAGKSLYFKSTANSGTASVTGKWKIDTASGATDGTGFGAAAYGSATTTITRPSSSTDGYTVILDSATGAMVGNGGENYEPMEISFGDQSLAVAVIAVGDEFEFPFQMAQLTKVTHPETRLSMYHLIRTLDSAGTPTDLRDDSGSIKVMRPYKPYYANGKKWPFTIDPTGDVAVTIQFKKRLFDRYFRIRQDQSLRFDVLSRYRNATPILGLSNSPVYEGVDVWCPQMAVTTAKSGDIPNKNTLEETITLEAEEPDTSVTPPSADFDGTSCVEINIVTTISPLWLA